jgi:sodium transport system permease protein
LLLLPATLLAGAAQLLVASGSRSFKEAQIALSMVLFVPMLPGLLLSLNPTETPEWMLAVPVVGHQLMVTDLITGEGVEWHWIGLLTVSSLAVTGVLLLLCAWLYKREAILFAR